MRVSVSCRPFYSANENGIPLKGIPNATSVVNNIIRPGSRHTIRFALWTATKLDGAWTRKVSLKTQKIKFCLVESRNTRDDAPFAGVSCLSLYSAGPGWLLNVYGPNLGAVPKTPCVGDSSCMGPGKGGEEKEKEIDKYSCRIAHDYFQNLGMLAFGENPDWVAPKCTKTRKLRNHHHKQHPPPSYSNLDIVQVQD